jgi:NTE family protein
VFKDRATRCPSASPRATAGVAHPHGIIARIRSLSDLALVLSGGGARAAYQVGVLRYLAREFPHAVPDILTGVSAGGINAAFLAARQEPYPDRVEKLATMWANLRIDDVFRVDIRDLTSRTLRWGSRLMGGGAQPLPPAKSLVDTAPLRAILERVLQAQDGVLEGVARNLEAGWLRAVALTASNYTTNQSITWVQTREDCPFEDWSRPQRRSARCGLRVDHVMASSALPFFFPAIEVEGCWYGDGGIRLTAPLSPAVHLGARRVLAVSTRYAKTEAEANRPQVPGYPPPAQVAGVLYDAIFLDQLDADALHMAQINELLQRLPGGTYNGLQQIDLMVLRPSEDLGLLANEYEPDLPRTFRFLTRGLGTRETRSNDMLSLMMFQQDYLTRLIEMGEADAVKRHSELYRFFSQ